jgi:hypothetical protein
VILRAQFIPDQFAPGEVCAVPTAHAIAIQDLLDQIVRKSAAEALRCHVLVMENAFPMHHVLARKVTLVRAARCTVLQKGGSFAQEEVFFMMRTDHNSIR